MLAKKVIYYGPQWEYQFIVTKGSCKCVEKLNCYSLECCWRRCGSTTIDDLNKSNKCQSWYKKLYWYSLGDGVTSRYVLKGKAQILADMKVVYYG